MTLTWHLPHLHRRPRRAPRHAAPETPGGKPSFPQAIPAGKGRSPESAVAPVPSSGERSGPRHAWQEDREGDDTAAFMRAIRADAPLPDSPWCNVHYAAHKPSADCLERERERPPLARQGVWEMRPEPLPVAEPDLEPLPDFGEYLPAGPEPGCELCGRVTGHDSACPNAEPAQHYLTGLCWCGDAHDQAPGGEVRTLVHYDRAHSTSHLVGDIDVACGTIHWAIVSPDPAKVTCPACAAAQPEPEPPTLAGTPAAGTLGGDQRQADKRFVTEVIGELYTGFWSGPWELGGDAA